ncbi:hypothetical protein CIB48_g6628 [Xylaria polymorpha]|nr:hypothetical protein CIB48_g6628 [Xylaria polymorpha]
MALILLTSVALFLLTPVCMASPVQDDWAFPQSPDRSTTLQLGTTYKIQWTSALEGWFPQYCPDCNPTSVDLWVTSASSNLLEHKIASGLDVASVLSIPWTVTIPAAELSQTRIWVFRFLPSGVEPSSTSEQISSSVFIIADPGAGLPLTSSIAVLSSTPSSSSTSVLSNTLSSSSINPVSSNTVVSSPTTSSTPLASTKPTMTTDSASSIETTTTSVTAGTETNKTPSSSGLSTGARAGIGVGAGLGALALFTFGWFLARHHGRKDSTTAQGGAETQNAGPGAYGRNYYGKGPHEVHGTPSQTAYPNSPSHAYSQPTIEANSPRSYSDRVYTPMTVGVNETRSFHHSAIEVE